MTDYFWKDARKCWCTGILAIIVAHLTGLVSHDNFLAESSVVFVGYFGCLGIIYYMRYKRMKS